MSPDNPTRPTGEPSPAAGELVRTLSRGGGIAVRALIGSNLIAEAMNRRNMTPTAANALGRALMGAVLIAVESGDAHAPPGEGGADASETVQLQFRGNGPLGSVVAISDSWGRVRGTVENPDAGLSFPDGSPDVARSIGLGALTVVRHKPGWREPYTGAVPLVSGEIAQDLTLYLSESEQIPSAMGLGVAMANDESAVAASGFLVQILPNADEEEVRQMEQNVLSLPKLTQFSLAAGNANELIDLLLSEIDSRDRHHSEPIFYCPCTRERALRTLALLDHDELQEIIRLGQSQEVCCHFCSRAYDLSADEIVAAEIRGQSSQNTPT